MKYSVQTLFTVLLVQAGIANSASCKYLPGDAGWPSKTTWNQLNTTVSGRLIATVPIGTPCHDPNYDAAACNALKANWEAPQTHYTTTHSMMQSFFANQSCDPFTPESKACVLGTYVTYAINVTSSGDVAAGVRFASANNIRLTIRNTGHDVFGRSTGAGSLAIWTHNLKSTQVKDYNSASYKGKALKVGAGVQGFEAIEAANAAGLVVVTGECATVGMAGGYIQGGGHSALSTQFGMGADQALEYEVVTTAGTVVTASPTVNSDLYWALSGGGPATYGIVTSVTVRAYPSLTIGGGSIQLAAAYTTPDNFYKAVSVFHSLIPRFTDGGAVLAYLVSKDFLVLGSATVYNSSAAYVQNLLTPFTSALTNLSIPFTQSYTEQSYRDHYNQYFGPLPFGAYEVAAYNFGGRLIPRSVLETNNVGFNAAVRNMTTNGALLGNIALNASKIPSDVKNSVFAGWRKASIHMQITTPYNSSATMEEILAAQAQITNQFQPQIEAVTPGSGAYMNEADYQTPDFKNTFFGSNYNALLAIKRKWDPSGLLYGLKLVGSDQWTVAKDGRMCRV